ncbi:MAG: hypothetical protein KDI62_21175 [Anaerolineae bacterium]|nr:hypothetical protein [Anaerolineae bacterium]
MLKRRIISVLVGLALLAATAGVSGIVADSAGLAAPAYACESSGTSGGNC